MKDESKRLSVAINFGDTGTVYGCGHALDTMLYAYELTTEDETWEWLSDQDSDMIDQILGDYDWEGYTLERLNILPTVSEDYLHGDYLRFEERERFDQYVKEDRARISDAVQESIGCWTTASLPSDLVKELKRVRDELENDARREWLEGNRSNPGALLSLSRALFNRYSDAEASWNPETDIVTIEASEDEWREWLGYDLDERETLPTVEELANIVKTRVLNKAAKIREVRIKKSEGRLAEYKRREEIKAAQLEKEKEEARQRKALKDQAS